eukprot:m.105010 g.105010  ORF g.105010 m.105010 type:complete len:271 (-) comp9121_c6_seq1:226-1038(-)
MRAVLEALPKQAKRMMSVMRSFVMKQRLLSPSVSPAVSSTIASTAAPAAVFIPTTFSRSLVSRASSKESLGFASRTIASALPSTIFSSIPPTSNSKGSEEAGFSSNHHAVSMLLSQRDFGFRLGNALYGSQFVRHMASASSPPEQEVEEDHVKDKRVMANMTAGQKFKYLSMRYGRFAILYYFVIGTIDIGIYYSLISSGVDVQPFLDTVFSWFGLNADFIHPNFGNLIAAYSLHKVLTVPRVLFVGSTTPYLVSRLKKKSPKLYSIVCR